MPGAGALSFIMLGLVAARASAAPQLGSSNASAHVTVESNENATNAALPVCRAYFELPDEATPGAQRPGFLIVGAQKAGTTYLHRVLAQMPGISEPTWQPAVTAQPPGLPPVYENITKELHFFDRANLDADAFNDQYLSAWRGTPEGDMLFESTPGYLPTPMAPYRISKLLPDAKILIMLREPAARAFSHWNMRQTFCQNPDKRIACPPDFATAVGREIEILKGRKCTMNSLSPAPDAWGQCFLCYFEGSCDFTEGIDTEPWFNEAINPSGPREECQSWSHSSGYVFRGMYAQQISWWLQFFHPSQLFVINQDDLAARPGQIVTEVLTFLGVPKDHKAIGQAVSNKQGAFRGSYSKNSKMTLSARASMLRASQRLKAFYATHNANLYKLLDNMGVQGFSRFDVSRLTKKMGGGTATATARLRAHRA